MKKLLVNRGLPGSGKSTRTSRIFLDLLGLGVEAVICSSDDYFICPCCKAYNFDRDRLGAAHWWCQRECKRAMERGVPVVLIDNTNITARECYPYVLLARQYGYEVEFLEPQTPWAFDIDELYRRNVHRVPRETLEKMLARWVPDMTVEKALNLTQPGEPTADEVAASGERRDILGTTTGTEIAPGAGADLPRPGDEGQRLLL